MSPSVPAPPALHELESEVMEEVWRQRRTNVRSVMVALNNKHKKDRAYTTYMTIMARLARKGLLDREREGKNDIYWPLLTREEFLQARAQEEVESLVSEFGEVALVHFAKEMDKLDPARVKRLRRLARDA
jgi:predicted transcriptional regulator